MYVGQVSVDSHNNRFNLSEPAPFKKQIDYVI